MSGSGATPMSRGSQIGYRALVSCAVLLRQRDGVSLISANIVFPQNNRYFSGGDHVLCEKPVDTLR
jgi:hypothetical protein